MWDFFVWAFVRVEFFRVYFFLIDVAFVTRKSNYISNKKQIPWRKILQKLLFSDLSSTGVSTIFQFSSWFWEIIVFFFGSIGLSSIGNGKSTLSTLLLQNFKKFLSKSCNRYFLGENFGFVGECVKLLNSYDISNSWAVAVSKSDLRQIIILISLWR